MRSTKIPLLTLLAVSALTGCAQPAQTIYQWGSYEEQIYAMYIDPGKAPIENQLQTLESDYQNIQASGGAAPPGFHAHLGYLYFQSGKPDRALQSFETEKALFPESTVFMNRLIARVKH